MRATAAVPEHAVRYAKNPGKYNKAQPTSAALITFLALLAIASLRRQRYPTWHEAGIYAVAAAVVALSAQVAPEFVTTLLVVTLIVVVLGNADLIADYGRRGLDSLQGALAPAA
jgi:hypothetical protein